MKKTDLNIFYQMGQALGYLIGGGTYGTGGDFAELAINLYSPREWAAAFLRETSEFDRYLRDSRKAACALVTAIDAVVNQERFKAAHPITMEECMALSGAKDEFEKCFERESRSISVFTVTPKGTRDTSILIECPERDFTDKQLAILPAQFIVDLKYSARCLAFDLPTACAFHVCRATESLIIAYYELLAGNQWSFAKRDWKIYIEQLSVKHAPNKITSRLDEIRKMDRNSYIHPDKDVSIEEARVLYGLCSAVNYYMAEEMIGLTP